MYPQKSGVQPGQAALLKPGHKPVKSQPSKPHVLQPKMATMSQMRQPPVAPPVYRPQAAPKTVQPKTVNAAPNRKPPVAHSALRQQSVPKVLQTKIAGGQQSQAGQTPRQPVAPPVYRPEAKKIAQPKMAATTQTSKQPQTPPVYRPQPVPKVLQTKRAVPERASALQMKARHSAPQQDVKGKLPPAIQPAKGGPRHPAPGKPPVIQRMALTVGDVDDVIRRSMGAILVNKERQPQPAQNARLPSLEYGNLERIGLEETLYLDGHGAAPEDDNGVPSAALEFGGYTPEALASKLVAKGLPQKYVGKIYLNGCFTATDNGGEAYCLRFQKALALRNRFAIVKGNKGSSQVQDDGKTRVIPPTAQSATEFTHLEKLVNTMHKFVNLDRRALTLPDVKVVGGGLLWLVADQYEQTWQSDKDLRPVHGKMLQTSHYEITQGNYAPIPENIHNGKSLTQYIKRALDNYDKEFHLFGSDESQAASPILRNLLNSPKKLFVAVRWYLAANQPKPPAEFVQVSAKLKVGSDLYNFLLEEFRGWES